ncbi:hypothetical protein SOVF_120910 [Spinacia oleracea]|uniref:Sacsin/Nov domain-containing protein n=1 Tax=Spinacia oleracea TaxID=3562 RepID=A0A9R0IBH1_SPIOL|nr:uncharacterized protein LOC110786023 [Spinacia oleracea]KNA12990.1 hypothetical protein SOVF_120910 [Spinacia oleracea]
MAAAKQHIEEIRKTRFEIGIRKNPLSHTLRMAVKYLSAELYSKDVHFLMELIQNAEDNEYPTGVDPSLEFLITSRDITATGATATLLIFNNENGFSPKNMESICNVGDSTKAGNRKSGYIGEKGIGFKSVFLLTSLPYIFSNGYQIRFNEAPCPECEIAYIVPEWVDYPSVSDIQQVYGCNRTLPTTTLILPLKRDKVKPVKEQLSSLHPELLLFLSKIKRLSVKEHNENPALNTIRAVSISTERDLVAKKDIDAESYTVHLTAEEEGRGSEGECGYYMWRQKFRVKEENKVEKRMELEEWPITLAFPFGKRLNRGMISPGIYAYLPTETVTNLPFIIQADFLLPSSRETILWDDIWNQGILDCIPTAFVNAFITLVKTREDAPASCLASMFDFLPVNAACHPKLDAVRESIREKLLLENIIPSEPHSDQKIFHKPQEVGRLSRSFWKILLKAKKEGIKLHNLSSLGKHILHSSFDEDKYNNALTFLDVKHVGKEWYPKCIQSCNLVLGVGDDIYIELLQFLAQNWTSHFQQSTMRSIPLLKYVGTSGDVSLLSINDASNQSSGLLCRSQDARHISWMIDWSKEFGSVAGVVFLPEKMQKGCVGVDGVLTWLKDFVKVVTLSVYDYSCQLQNSLSNNCRMVFAYAHFLHYSFSKGLLSELEVQKLCAEMPLVNSYGGVSVKRKGVLVPANGSKWVDLIGSSNSWGNQDYVVLSDDYLHSVQYAGYCTPDKKKLMEFLKSYAGASDIPDVCPPDAGFPTVSGPLTKDNVFLLLEWIRKLRYKGIKMPDKFLSCIEKGSWLRVTMSGSPVYRPPNQSFLSSSSWGSLLQNGSEMVDIPLVDQRFYNYKINDYKEELKAIGVMFDYGQACEFIGKHLMALAKGSNLTRTKVIAMLDFIRYLREKMLSVDEIVNSVKEVKWVKTSCGERSPIETVLFDDSWKIASVISQIPFLDQQYYGNNILQYKTELELLGITVGFKGNHQIVLDHIKPSPSWRTLKPDHLQFALKCITSCSRASEKLVGMMKNSECLSTSVGFKYPRDCFLFDREWGCILQIFEDFPYIDNRFYGDGIFKFKEALQKIGVFVDFGSATKALSSMFTQRASTHQLTNDTSLSLISCYKKLKHTLYTIPADILEARWLRTRLGDFRSPKDCILYDTDWRPISGITLLPFIDDKESCYGKDIHEFKDELKSIGVTTDFKEGSQFVFSHIFFPQDPREITPECVISLLECVKRFLKSGNSFPDNFLVQVDQTKWLKTTIGCMSPKECMLFDPKKGSLLQRCDGPFIDEEYYGANISSYKKELSVLKVVTDMSSTDASSLLAIHIKSLCEFAKIEHIYSFLSKTDWEPDANSLASIWFPTSSVDGVWVTAEECVLHDVNHLFSSRLCILDQKYNKPELLDFFAKAFNVKSCPSTDHYCELWSEWENSGLVISHVNCRAFWVHVIRHWSKKTEKIFSESVTKIPADSKGSDDILLRKKQDIFLPNDLLLKNLFEMSSPYSIFVWCPPVGDLPSIPRAMLLDIYSKIGVRKITDSVSISELSAVDLGELEEGKLKDAFIVKGLVMIILGFLSDPSLNTEVKFRHEAVKMLLTVKVFVTTKPITMSYTLEMSSGDDVTASTSQMVRWERDNSKFFTQKLNWSGADKAVVDYATKLEYATKFSQVISEGLLWEKEDKIHILSDLIKVGVLMDFDEDAVKFLMTSKNLQIFPEDEEFLCSVFPSC